MTVFTGLNLLTAGIAYAQKTQGMSVTIRAGTLSLFAPDNITFQKGILDPNHPLNLTAILDPSGPNQTTGVVDPWDGGTFCLNITLNNLTNGPTGRDVPPDIFPFSQLRMITLHSNTRADSVDIASLNNPAETNNVTSDPGLAYYFNQQTSNPENFTDNVFTVIPAQDGDTNPNDIGHVSKPYTIMQRNIAKPSLGIYSVGLAFRANIPAGTHFGNYAGEATFSLDTPCP